MKLEWIRCPICSSKTRDRIRADTIMKNYPLYCPKCKQETLINVKELQVTVIKAAAEVFFRLVVVYANRQGVTEQLKSKNQFLWIYKMNNILACVREIVENEIIYS